MERVQIYHLELCQSRCTNVDLTGLLEGIIRLRNRSTIATLAPVAIIFVPNHRYHTIDESTEAKITVPILIGNSRGEIK